MPQATNTGFRVTETGVDLAKNRAKIARDRAEALEKWKAVFLNIGMVSRGLAIKQLKEYVKFEYTFFIERYPVTSTEIADRNFAELCKFIEGNSRTIVVPKLMELFKEDRFPHPFLQDNLITLATSDNTALYRNGALVLEAGLFARSKGMRVQSARVGDVVGDIETLIPMTQSSVHEQANQSVKQQLHNLHLFSPKGYIGTGHTKELVDTRQDTLNRIVSTARRQP